MKTSERRTREQLIEAAQQVVLAGGAGTLTLDAVAREAGVSKGGLLYHFPSKDDLIIAMIDALCVGFESALDEAMQGEPTTPGRFTRAYVRATFTPEREGRALSTALFAAGATNPALVAPFRERMVGWQRKLDSDGIDPAVATLIRLAADGLWFAELGDFAPPPMDVRERIQAALLALTE